MPTINQLVRQGRKAAAKKPAGMEILSTMLTTHPHHRVPAEMVDGFAAELAAQAAEMVDVNTRYDTEVARNSVLRTQRRATVTRAQRRLLALKRFWLGEGLSLADIHGIIPDVPRGDCRDDDELEQATDDTLDVTDEVLEEAQAAK